MATPTEARQLNVGIVSKPEHCRGLLKALSKMPGIKPHMLGGHVRGIPSSMDVVVLRTASCAHVSSDTAFEEFRNGGRPVIVQNGVSRVVQSLEQLQAGTYEPIATNVAQIEQKTPPVEDKPMRTDRAIVNIIQHGGFFFPKLRDRYAEEDDPAQRTIDLFYSVGTAAHDCNLDVLRASLQIVHERSESVIPTATTRVRTGQVPDFTGPFNETMLFSLTKAMRVRPLNVLTREEFGEPQVALLAEMTGFYPTRTAAKKAKKAGAPSPAPVPAPAAPVFTECRKCNEPLGYAYGEPTTCEDCVELERLANPKPESKEPVRGNPHRAYWRKTKNHWQIEAYWKKEHKYVCALKTRDEAVLRVLELDEAWAQPEPTPPPAPAPAPAPAPEPLEDPDPNAELASIFEMLKEQLAKMGLDAATHHGVHAEVLIVHFIGPDGIECGGGPKRDLTGKPATSKLSEVTCGLCKNTRTYKTAVWALGNVQA